MDSDPPQISLMFELIKDEWLAIPSQRRPWGIWITQHAPLPSDTHSLPHQTRTLQRAWLLQDNIFPPEPRDPWEYARFFIMHFARPWDPYYLASIDPRFHRDRKSVV